MEYEFICHDYCKYHCGEYNGRSICDKNYYEWELKQKQCIKQFEDNHSNKEERR